MPYYFFQEEKKLIKISKKIFKKINTTIFFSIEITSRKRNQNTTPKENASDNPDATSTGTSRQSIRKSAEQD